MSDSTKQARTGTLRKNAIRALVAASAATAAVAVAAPAQAQTVKQIRNWNNGLCLDSNWQGSAYTLGCNGGDYQRWRIEPASSFLPYYDIINVATGRCLDSNHAGHLYTLPCQDQNDYQTWALTFGADNPPGDRGSVARFRNVATNRFLEGDRSGGAFTNPQNSTGQQDWKRNL